MPRTCPQQGQDTVTHWSLSALLPGPRVRLEPISQAENAGSIHITADTGSAAKKSWLLTGSRSCES